MGTGTAHTTGGVAITSIGAWGRAGVTRAMRSAQPRVFRVRRHEGVALWRCSSYDSSALLGAASLARSLLVRRLPPRSQVIKLQVAADSSYLYTRKKHIVAPYTSPKNRSLPTHAVVP